MGRIGNARKCVSDWAHRLKGEMLAMSLAVKDPRTPWHAKILGAAVLGYALSPVDLIPDFIPVLGYLDDLFLVPAGIALALRLIPREVMEDCRTRAGQAGDRSRHWAAAAVIALVWLLLLGLAALSLIRALAGRG